MSNESEAERSEQMSDGVYDVDVAELVEFAKKYAELGGAVQEQLDDLLAGRFDEPNPAAVDMIQQALGSMNEELDDVLQVYCERGASR